MDILTLTRRRLYRPGLRVEHKQAAIETLVDFLVAESELRGEHRDAVLETVLARERLLSTGLEDGIAIPHGIVDVIESEVAALGTVPGGLPFESFDGQPARLIILLLTPRKMVFRHVRNLAGIARLLRHAELRGALLAATTSDQIVKALEDALRSRLA